MRARGLEPPRAEAHRDLNPERLPVPPRPRGWSVSPRGPRYISPLHRWAATTQLLELPHGPGGGARRQPRPPHGRRLSARARARGGACRGRSRRIGQDPRVPQGQGAAPGTPRERRPRSAVGRGRRVAHRRLVLERCVAVAATPGGNAGVRLRASRQRGRALDVQRHGRGAANPRDRRLDDARGAACRVGGARGARSAGARRAPQLGRRARARRRPRGARGRHTRRRSRGRGRRRAVRHRRRARLAQPRRGDRASARRRTGRRHQERPLRACRGRRDHRLGDGQARQREGASRGRRRARALGQRVRHARGAPCRHRGPDPHGHRRADRLRVQGGRRRRARSCVERAGGRTSSSRLGPASS